MRIITIINKSLNQTTNDKDNSNQKQQQQPHFHFKTNKDEYIEYEDILLDSNQKVIINISKLNKKKI